MAIPRSRLPQAPAVDENTELRKRVEVAELEARLVEAQFRAMDARAKILKLRSEQQASKA